MGRFSMPIFSASLSLAAAFACVIFAGGAWPAHAAWDGARRDGDYYWTVGCVVIARVAEAHRTVDASVDPLDTVIARPLGTLSGGFDAGKTPQVVIRGIGAADGLHSGDTILAALRDNAAALNRPNNEAIYFAGYGPFPYMPRGSEAIVRISGFSDESVQGTLKMIQKLRRKPEVKPGDTPQYWQRHCVVLAEAETISMARTHADSYVFRIIGTVSGGYDAGKMLRFSLVLGFDELHSVLDERLRGVRPHDVMLLLLEKDESDGQWRIPVERAAFMPFTHDPMIKANKDWGEQPNNAVGEAMDSTLSEIQKRRAGGTAGTAAQSRGNPPTRD
jgi:hypothetical protein